jgi:hypothetical protein
MEYILRSEIPELFQTSFYGPDLITGELIQFFFRIGGCKGSHDIDDIFRDARETGSLNQLLEGIVEGLGDLYRDPVAQDTLI